MCSIFFPSHFRKKTEYQASSAILTFEPQCTGSYIHVHPIRFPSQSSSSSLGATVIRRTGGGHEQTMRHQFRLQDFKERREFYSY